MRYWLQDRNAKELALESRLNAVLESRMVPERAAFPN